MSISSQDTFVCPECQSKIPATGEVRAALLRAGCPHCTASVTSDHFEN